MSLSSDLDRVSVTFGDKAALSNLTFSLDGGKIYGLLGRNGAGKSTLLSLLGALRHPASGTVKVNGEVLFENYRMTQQVCLIRESPDVLDADEKLDYNLEFARTMRPNWDEPYARELVQKFAIPHRSENRHHVTRTALRRGNRDWSGQPGAVDDVRRVLSWPGHAIALHLL